MNSRWRFSAVVVAVACIMTAPSAAFADFSSEVLLLDVRGARGTLAGDTRSAVVGGYASSDLLTHGFIDQRGAFASFDIPGVRETRVPAINSAGTNTGSIISRAGGGPLAFLYDRTTVELLQASGAVTTAPMAISESGVVVGAYSSGVAAPGVVYKDADFSVFDVPGTVATFVLDISDNGRDLVGLYDGANGRHGFFYDAGRSMALLVPLSVETVPLGLFNDGTVVRDTTIASRLHRFIYDDGQFSLFDVPFDRDTRILGINATRDVVGDTNLGDHGFLVAQIPAAPSVLLIISGVAMVWLTGRSVSFASKR
jgi:hypothetical protein